MSEHTIQAMIDYLPVAVRAAAAKPDSTLLWAEAARAQRDLIAYADAILPEPQAADVQTLAGTIADIATWSDDYARAWGAAWSEASKARIRALIAAA